MGLAPHRLRLPLVGFDALEDSLDRAARVPEHVRDGHTVKLTVTHVAMLVAFATERLGDTLVGFGRLAIGRGSAY